MPGPNMNGATHEQMGLLGRDLMEGDRPYARAELHARGSGPGGSFEPLTGHRGWNQAPNCSFLRNCRTPSTLTTATNLA